MIKKWVGHQHGLSLKDLVITIEVIIIMFINKYNIENNNTKKIVELSYYIKSMNNF